MEKKQFLAREVGWVSRALGSAFSGRVLAWQLGGTMLAALLFAVTRGLATRADDRALLFLLTALAFVAAYVILAATGCLVTRVIQTAGEEKAEGGVAPLHFLIDHVGAALLLPFIGSAAAVVLAAIFCAPAALWDSATWQGILVIPSVVAFVVVLAAVADLFVFLFTVPAMIASEQPPFAESFRRICRFLWVRKWELARVFAIGLTVAVVLVVPAMLLAFVARGVCAWIYAIACGAYLTSFARFVLDLFSSVLLWAPILTVPLAFLNALSFAAYGELARGLEPEAEEEHGEVPSGGEDVDLEVEGETGDQPTEDESP